MSEPLSPTPALIFDLFQSHQRTAALKSAVELDLFTAIGEGANKLTPLAKRIKASEKGTRVLADYLVTLGLLEKSDFTYSLGPVASMFLDKRSRAYMGGMAQFLASDALLDLPRQLTAIVKKGGTIAGEGTMEPDNAIWVDFAESMTPLAIPAAMALAEQIGASGKKVSRILDISASHGMYGIHMALKFPDATAVGLDWPRVLEVAKRNASAMGVAARYQTIPGSVFDVSLGSDYDVVLIPNFYHHFNRATCVGLAKKIHASLAPGGVMLTVEFVPNSDRVTPPMPSQFALQMLIGTSDGDAYPFDEFRSMFAEAGFSSSTLHDIPMSPQNLIVSTR